MRLFLKFNGIYYECFDLPKAKIQIKIGFKNHNPSPNVQCLPNLFATLKKETINAIRNTGGINNDRTHHPDIPAILNRK